MDRRQLLFGMTALALGSSKLSSLSNAQISETAGWLTETRSIRKSDSEKRGLRGPVRMCIGDESSATEYDLNGNILSERGTDSRGKWGMTWAYDGDGRLLKYTWSGSDGSTTEQVYSYNEAGRLVGIANGNGDRTGVQYDEQGRKTEIQSVVAQRSDVHGHGLVAVSGGAFMGEGIDLSYVGGGTVTTLYNEHDQPTESQVRDTEGHLLTRIVRSYDTNGRLSEEKAIPENPEFALSQKMLKEMLPGLPEEYRTEALTQIRQQLKALYGDELPESRSYAYDAQNRVIKRSRTSRSFPQEVTTTYNDRGDIVEESTIQSEPFGPAETADETTPAAIQLRTTERYTYQYDSYGNWTEKVEERDRRPFATRRRQLTYY